MAQVRVPGAHNVVRDLGDTEAALCMVVFPDHGLLPLSGGEVRARVRHGETRLLTQGH